MALPEIFTNKYLLYFVVFLSVTNLIGYLVMGNINVLIYFILIGFVTSLFSKNMIIVLSSALILSNIFSVGQSYSEGFTSTDASGNDSSSPIDASGNNSSSATDASGNTISMSSGNQPTSSPIKLMPLSVNDGPMEPTSEPTLSENNDTSEVEDINNVVNEAFQSCIENTNRKNYSLGYASTIEEAYGTLK
jgi:hypothetical protein